jgi:hypothetical protein
LAVAQRHIEKGQLTAATAKPRNYWLIILKKPTLNIRYDWSISGKADWVRPFSSCTTVSRWNRAIQIFTVLQHPKRRLNLLTDNGLEYYGSRHTRGGYLHGLKNGVGTGAKILLPLSTTSLFVKFLTYNFASSPEFV